MNDGPVQDARIRIPIVRLDQDIPLPGYENQSDAGADLCCTADVELAPGERRTVGTGIALAIPEGYVGLVHPRSGLAARRGLTVVNAPGTIDAGYRGEIKIPLLNTDTRESVTLHRFDRVAQLLIQRVFTADFVTMGELPDSQRGTDGFGSTGGAGELATARPKSEN